jgi:diguanylate cyclase (GGDEF)-like protein/PAS domain S-box-containing protein
MTRKLFHTDKQTWAILLLALLTAGLLGYLISIDRDIQSFNNYETTMQRMLLLDRTFDNFLLRKIEAQNYETINRKLDEFERLLEYLKSQPLSREYDLDTTPLLASIEKTYREKRENIERFKSYNAAALNSIHYIFDLRRTLANDPEIPTKLQTKLDTILFELMQLILGIHPSMEALKRSLEELKVSIQPLRNRHLFLYLDHSVSLMASVKKLYDTSRRGRALPLSSRIATLKNRLEKAYEHKIFVEKVIALLFFVISFSVLLTLAWLNQMARKTYKRLQAFIYAVENSDNTIVMTDPDRNIVYVNEVFEKATGYTREEAIGQNPRILKSGEQDESYYAEMNRTLDAGKKWEGIFINKRKDGTLFYEKASIVPVHIDGELTNYLAIKLDITEYVEQQKRLRLSAAVFENAQESIFITDRENRIVSVNKAFTAITGYTEEEVLGKNPNILKSGHHDEEFYRKMWYAIERTGTWHGRIDNRVKSGEIIPGLLTISTVYDEKGNVLNYIGMFTDLRDIITSQEKAEYLAFHDVLTGLPNRARFEEHLTHVLEVAERMDHRIAVLFIDLDRFKVINDTLGHDIGDELLKKVSERIRSTLRKSDHLARIGGDEFVAILETIQSAEDAAYVCEKILQVIAEPFRIGNNTLNISTSIGVALFPDNGRDITELIKNADNAMYLAKSLGKNNFQFFMPELSRRMHRRLEIEQGLTNALKNGEFWLAYQPQYRLDDHTLYGAEALLRWESPALGIVPPDEFIPVAEETGKITAIGRFVFEEACKTLARLDAEGYRLDNIAVNVSSKQFTDKSFPDFITDTVKRYGLTPDRITLEITERYIMDTSAYDDKLLDTFKEMGFGISVDDFGTGYSSMSYLKKLPIDTIKIDKSFIQDIPHDVSDNEITKAIIVLTESLGYKAVAEGIENVEQEAFLIEHGCHYGQGYFFSRPLAFDDFIRFVSENTQIESIAAE